MNTVQEVPASAIPTSKTRKDRNKLSEARTAVKTDYKEGETVRIIDRAPVAADAKSGLYFSHYRNLSGRIFRLYGEGDVQQAAIEIDQATLPAEVALRHNETRDQMFNSLPADARRQSQPGTPTEFRLRYIVLVSVQDLV